MPRRFRTLVLVLLLAAGLSSAASARTTLNSICHVKGQEENTLHGIGIVVGLKGTGDGGEYLPMVRTLATAISRMGNHLGTTGTPDLNLKELKDTKNVALVMVTATVPAGGGRQGDKLNCKISSIGNAKSLVGGTLFVTPLQGPVPSVDQQASNLFKGPDVGRNRVYGFAQGDVVVDDAKTSTTIGKIFEGAQLEADFYHPFMLDNKITLVLDRDHAGFQVAQDIADLINSSQLSFEAQQGYLARAVNQVNIQVAVPKQYRNDPVLYVSQVLSLPIQEPQVKAGRVVINEKTGSIVIDGDVEIGAVVVTHKDIVIDTDPANSKRFVPLDPEGNSNTKLKALVDALNRVNARNEDTIDIIKSLKRMGKLHGNLIIE